MLKFLWKYSLLIQTKIEFVCFYSPYLQPPKISSYEPPLHAINQQQTSGIKKAKNSKKKIRCQIFTIILKLYQPSIQHNLSYQKNFSTLFLQIINSIAAHYT